MPRRPKPTSAAPPDLARLEQLLTHILAALRESQAGVRVERDIQAGGSVFIFAGAAGGEVRFPLAQVDQLGQLAHGGDGRRREEIYLAQFFLNALYARWDRAYLPLAGSLLDAPLRLSDRGDQGLSAAGVSIPDVRQALTDFGKPRLVILGDPGAGKTTTLQRLALDLARERLRDAFKGKLPLRVDLFKFTDDRQPSDFLRAEWETRGLGEPYGEAVARGQVCFLLDGVNQMPLADRAKRIDRWAHWATAELPPGNWAVFTCRSADYVTDLRLPEVRVQSLDPDRMRRYFELRFEPARAAEIWRDFEQRLHTGDDRFERLARNPFMLARLADRYAEKLAPTDNRALLMDDLAYGLFKRELEDGRQPEALIADPRGTLNAALEALSRLAFAMQAKGEGTGLTRATATRVQLSDKGQPALALADVLNLAVDATVLEATSLTLHGRSEPGHAFYHHLLQEYFAARELLRQFRAKKNLARYWRVAWRQWQFLPKRFRPGERLEPPPVTGWEETVVMAAGLAGPDAPRFIEAVKQANLPLAGRCLAEAGADRADLHPLTDSIRADLLTRQRSASAHLRARLDAGLALGEAGHPDLRPQPFEFEGRAVWAILPPRQSIPAGEFLRGSERDDKDAYPAEYTSERRVTLPAYGIGRYPVTNAEYKLFIEDGGYKTDRWWSAAGWLWKQGGAEAHTEAIADWMKQRKAITDVGVEKAAAQLSWRPQTTRYWKEVTQLSDAEALERARKVFDRPFDRPGYWDDRVLNSPARPVVGVNWHEAEAYCRWLSAVTAQTFRLPTELEWEKAARGSDGRAYPWGQAFDSARANTVESHIYATTPVGLYPNGVSPYGLFDVSGNVWEWTGDWYEMYPGGEPSDDFGEKFRGVRGGSWFSNRWSARCAYRGRGVPVNFYLFVGFRVLSPGSISGF